MRMILFMVIGAIVYKWLEIASKEYEEENNNNRKGDRNFTVYTNDDIDDDINKV
jgi:hypothetical protein